MRLGLLEPTWGRGGRSAVPNYRAGVGRMKLLVVGLSAVVVVLALVWASLCSAPPHRSHAHTAKLHALGSKLELFVLDVGCLPGGLDDLLQSSLPEWNGPYAKPQDVLDAYGNRFVYTPDPIAGGFALSSFGADGKSGGDGYAGDTTLEFGGSANLDEGDRPHSYLWSTRDGSIRACQAQSAKQ